MGRAFEYRKAAKMKRWGNMSKLFPKLGKLITIAAKEGGIDPDMNPKLRSAILNAKSQNMPKDNIEAAIKRASGKDAQDISELTYEGKGPHGVLLFIECASDNSTRTVANIKSYFNKCGGQLLVNGSLEFMFDRKAVFEFEMNQDINLEELELTLIDSGLEDLEVFDDIGYVYADFKDFGSLSLAFEELGIEIKKATLQRIPNNPQDFSEEQLEEIEKLIERIEEDEDVQNVFNNMA